MSRNCLFKVEHGDVMRRFRLIIAPSSVEQDYLRLMRRIRSAFNIPVTSIPIITYTDSVGDVVAITDHNDLQDMYEQGLFTVYMTVTSNTPSSNDDASSQQSSTVGIPPWAADIMLKLDQVLHAVNNHFVESAVESMMPTSPRALEQIAAKLGISMIDEPATEPVKDVLPTQKGTPYIEQSGPESEFLRRFFILQQRALNESKATTALSEDSETYVLT